MRAPLRYANLTGKVITGKKYFSSFNLEDEILVTLPDSFCKGYEKTIDKKLQDFMKDMSRIAGFKDTELLSLFEIPMLLKPYVDDDGDNTDNIKNFFFYSQCQEHSYDKGKFHFKEDNYTFWTSLLNHKLEPIMHIMRMANGRGKSHYNQLDFISSLLENIKADEQFIVPNISQLSETIVDMKSFIPSCKYIKGNQEECQLFNPVITDLGICYAFNSEPINDLLSDSSFTQTFLKVYKSELNDSRLLKASGSGDAYSLRFIIDNSQYLRQQAKVMPYLLAVASKTSILQG